ncbi:TetR/AcrR family transcriptional regulator [Streptomyces sp. NPDC054833]
MGSQGAGLLSAVMEQGAHAFFAAMREAHRNPPTEGSPRDLLRWYMRRTGDVIENGERFLRLLFVLVMSREAAEAPEALQTVIAVRDEGRAYMAHMIRSSFVSAGEETADNIAETLAPFGMAGYDGAFVALHSEGGQSVSLWMDQLADSLAALGEAIAAAG